MKMKIRPFARDDQEKCKELILGGLAEHFGSTLDTIKFPNPDLDDISKTYKNETFLVVESGGEMIGTGAVIEEDKNTGRVVRMSVSREHRRKGIGTEILNELRNAAKERGYQHLVVETTMDWKYVIDFYLRNGFEITGYRKEDNEVDMQMGDEGKTSEQ